MAQYCSPNVYLVQSIDDEIRNLETVHNTFAGMVAKPVVGLVDAFTHRAANGVEQSIIVLEYIEFDLAALLELGSERLSFSRSQLKCIMKQILEGLNTLSSCGLMHRDLKVMNVLISASGHTKLGDLGSATSFVSRSRFSSEVCTLWYRAPELLLGCEQYDSKVDIWSAAVVFAELCLCSNFVRGSNIETQFIELVKFFGMADDVHPIRSSLGNRADEMLAWASAAFQADGGTSPGASATWEKLSSRLGPEGIDLLKRMFAFNPAKRPSAQECLQHPFFSSYPAPAPRVLLPNGLEELHAFEHAAARLRKEQQEQSQQLQLLQRKRAEAQPPRKLSPEHNPTVADVLHALLTPNSSVRPGPESNLARPPKPRKNMSVSFALERNEQQFYSPSDAPCKVSSARSRKRKYLSTDEDTTSSDRLERPAKLPKLADALPAAQPDQRLQSRSLPKIVIRNGSITLAAAPSASPFVPPESSVLFG
eukprot:TRINITY_DN284_c0_g1_i1.p1 TRINITY_DN284_c0_g1~~TRINITY_DN284_c0_g1_i1.p1  ORF type:complete len:479 (+),score=93.29 TRINITY_DN284_c0_g1_i1:464-1900(+)